MLDASCSVGAVDLCLPGGVATRSVDSPHYHIWTDALHGRRLALEASNEWDRGTYVRWTIASAWTAFETTCEHLTGSRGLGNRFKDNFNEALDAVDAPRPDWGYGLWQDVLDVYRLRKDYVHPGVSQDQLFAHVDEAERAIAVLRRAIKDVYSRTETPEEPWPNDDEDPIDPRKEGVAHSTLIRAGASRESGVRICYVLLGKEHEHQITGPHADHIRLMEELLHQIRVPISAVRAYRGGELIDEIVVQLRRGS